MSKWVVNGLAVAIMLVWAGSMTTTFIRPDYAPPASVQWTMSILAGAAFGKAVISSGDEGQRRQ